jgi:hypothetical protein
VRRLIHTANVSHLFNHCGRAESARHLSLFANNKLAEVSVLCEQSSILSATVTGDLQIHKDMQATVTGNLQIHKDMQATVTGNLQIHKDLQMQATVTGNLQIHKDMQATVTGNLQIHKDMQATVTGDLQIHKDMQATVTGNLQIGTERQQSTHLVKVIGDPVWVYDQPPVRVVPHCRPKLVHVSELPRKPVPPHEIVELSLVLAAPIRVYLQLRIDVPHELYLHNNTPYVNNSTERQFNRATIQQSDNSTERQFNNTHTW